MRKIKSHKGGRTITIRARLTEVEKEIVNAARIVGFYFSYISILQ